MIRLVSGSSSSGASWKCYLVARDYRNTRHARHSDNGNRLSLTALGNSFRKLSNDKVTQFVDCVRNQQT